MADDTKDVDSVISDLGLTAFHFGALLISGCCFMGEMMELQLLTILGHQLQCEWSLSEGQKASITSAGFVGMLVGDIVLGPLSDRIGRRDVVSLSCCMIFVYGSLTALAPSLWWLVTLRCLTGFWIGGCVPSVCSYMLEMTPTRHRGRVWYCLVAFLGLGPGTELLLGWALMYRVPYDWRWLSLASASPFLLLSLASALWLPRSPRYCLQAGRQQEAADAISRIAASAGRQLKTVPKLRVASQSSESSEAGNLLLLFHPQVLLRETLVITLLMFCTGSCMFAQPQLNLQIPLLQAGTCRYSANETADVAGCRSCYRMEFLQLIVPSLADSLSCLLGAFLLDPLASSRRLEILIGTLLCAALMPLESLCLPRPVPVLIFFVVRMCSTFTYTTVQLLMFEYFPTTLRGSGSAVGYGAVRFGSAASPLVTQVFATNVSVLGACLVVSGLYLLASVCALLLPFDTKNRPMTQTVGQSREPATQQMLAGDGGGVGDYGSLVTEEH